MDLNKKSSSKMLRAREQKLAGKKSHTAQSFSRFPLSNTCLYWAERGSVWTPFRVFSSGPRRFHHKIGSKCWIASFELLINQIETWSFWDLGQVCVGPLDRWRQNQWTPLRKLVLLGSSVPTIVRVSSFIIELFWNILPQPLFRSSTILNNGSQFSLKYW